MRVQSAEPVYTLQLKKEKRKEISRMDVLGSEPFFRPILPTDRKVTWGVEEEGCTCATMVLSKRNASRVTKTAGLWKPNIG